MYAGTVFLGGRHGELGADAVFEDVTAAEKEQLAAALDRWKVPAPTRGFPQNGRRKTSLEFRESGQRLVEVSFVNAAADSSRKNHANRADS